MYTCGNSTLFRKLGVSRWNRHLFRWFTVQWYTVICWSCWIHYSKALETHILDFETFQLTSSTGMLWMGFYVPLKPILFIPTKRYSSLFFYLGCVWSLWVWPWICLYIKLYTTTLTSKWVNMSKWVCSSEQKKES